MINAMISRKLRIFMRQSLRRKSSSQRRKSSQTTRSTLDSPLYLFSIGNQDSQPINLPDSLCSDAEKSEDSSIPCQSVHPNRRTGSSRMVTDSNNALVAVKHS
jgi:hypothetical protein